MIADLDPFVHQPELRGKIRDPLTCWARKFRPSDLDQRLAALGAPPDWRYTDARREQMRRQALTGRTAGDLWVFAYGSLMWDPGVRFAEVRKAHLTGYRRHFCLKDVYGARGTPQAPGLLAALDEGGRCDGLVFRIREEDVEEETEVLWRREMPMPGYLATFLDVETALGDVRALVFIADRAAEKVIPGIERSVQVQYIRTAAGFAGSNLEYLENLASQLTVLGIEDRDLLALLQDVRQASSR
ncbi:MAG: gamma-glutamylcyclotransferase [Burkholderiales bacterium]|nr:MAG: gamma-glutamylcyclotransferase [Burkholderiales bacterium]